MAGFESVLLTLPSLAPSLAVELIPHGLTFHRFFVQVDGRTHDIVVSPEDPKGHLQQKYVNTIIGRYTNRVPVGTFEVEKNGVKASVTAHANESSRVSLHGGPKGYDFAVWERLTTPPTLFSEKEVTNLPTSSSATSYAFFKHLSPNGDEGYPGTLTVEVLVALVEPPEQEKTYQKPGEPAQEGEFSLGTVVYVYRAKVDKGVTPINLTNHWGFNLDASLQEGKPEEYLPVADHHLYIKSDRIVKRDPDSLNTFEAIYNKDTPSHKYDGKKIGENSPEKGYDDFYFFNGNPSKAPRKIPLKDFGKDFDLLKDILASTPVSDPVAKLWSDKSGLSVSFESNQTGVMFYSGVGLDPVKTARKKIHGGSGEVGDGYRPGSAAFLEFHEPLANFLNPAAKNTDDDTLLTSDELYHNYVKCEVKFKNSSN